MIHKLKTHPSVAEELWHGLKTFEFRKNDRNFKVGDILELSWFDADINSYVYSYPVMRFEVTYILYGPNFGVPEEYCVMSIVPE